MHTGLFISYWISFQISLLITLKSSVLLSFWALETCVVFFMLGLFKLPLALAYLPSSILPIAMVLSLTQQMYQILTWSISFSVRLCNTHMLLAVSTLLSSGRFSLGFQLFRLTVRCLYPPKLTEASSPPLQLHPHMSLLSLAQWVVPELPSQPLEGSVESL